MTTTTTTRRYPSRGGKAHRAVRDATEKNGGFLLKMETKAVHAGRGVDPATGAVTPPIHLSTTFERRRRELPARLRVHQGVQPQQGRPGGVRAGARRWGRRGSLLLGDGRHDDGPADALPRRPRGCPGRHLLRDEGDLPGPFLPLGRGDLLRRYDERGGGGRGRAAEYEVVLGRDALESSPETTPGPRRSCSAPSSSGPTWWCTRRRSTWAATQT